MAKTPLLLLPGTLCNEQLWAHQIDHLSDLAEITVGDVTTQPTIKGMARHMLEQAPDRFALAGLSLGGIVAIEIMRQAPERVLKLALLDTTAQPPRAEQMDIWGPLIKRVSCGEFSTVVREKFLPNLLYEAHPLIETLSSNIIDMAEKVGKEAYINQLKAVMTKPNGFDVLPNIRCQTLLIVGREDRLCPVDIHMEMKEKISYANLVEIEQCGHMSTLEQPEAVSAAMRNWLIS
ncbi:alpha/beta hydrolase [Ammoniphilus sp. CFH 90114]|nr:alpha/beta hydrolase [Ammoniphilus sp. CFH 90114]